MDTNLYLVGFMGTGKSTVGRQVARQLMGFEFLDSDHEIERLQGKPVAQIFAEQGEAKFRALEREFIEHGHPAKKCIISCGHRSVSGEDIPRGDDLQRRVEVELVFGHAASNQLE